MRRHPISYRCLAVFLSLTLALGMLPTTAFAAGQPVAKIGNVGYTTLGAAVSDAQPGASIVLVADDDSQQQITIDKNLSIELDGHNLPSTAFQITAGTVNISDQKGTGIINGDHYAGFIASEINRCSSSIYITGTAQVTLNDLRVEQCAERDLDKAIFLGGSASLTINGGSYTGPREAGVDAIFYHNDETTSSLTINDGYFDANCGLSVNQTPGSGGGTLVIRKATFVGNGTAFWIQYGGGAVSDESKAQQFLASSTGSYIVGTFNKANIVIGSDLFVSDGFDGVEYGNTDQSTPAQLTPTENDPVAMLPQILGGDDSEYTYVWSKDGSVIEGATGPSYNIDNYDPATDDGIYSVTVSQGDKTITLYWQVGTPAPEPVSYDLWVDGTQVTSGNAEDILSDGTVSYDSASNTLTLDGANLTSTHTGNRVAAAIFANDSMGTLNIHVTGENTIDVTQFGTITAGVYGFQDVVFEGDGSLNVKATSLGSEGNAVYAHTGDVTINSGTYTFEGDGTGCYGIFAGSNSGTVYVNGGALTTSAGATGSNGVAIGGTLDFSQHTGCEIKASLNASGTPEVTYDPTQQNTYHLYKYIAVKPTVVVTPEYDENGFQTNGDGYQPAQLVDGVYQIENAGQLFWFAQQVKASGEGTEMNAQLVNNIIIPAGRTWTPMSVAKASTSGVPYTGTFDGASHTISGLQTINQHGGLFKSLAETSVVKDLGIINSSFTGSSSDYVGSIAATNYGTIQNCYNTCPVTGQLMFVGGIVGENKGTIENCYNTGAITVNGQGEGGGGICGTARENAVIENCYNTGSVSGRWGVSGICGYFTADTIRITNCHNTGSLSIINNGYPETVHGIAYAKPSTLYQSAVENCYYVADEANENGGKTQAQFASGEVTWLLNHETSTGAWGQTLGTDQIPILDGAAVYAGYEFCYSDSISYSNDSTTVHTEKPDHDFTVLKYDATSHWYACANPGCAETSGTQAHTGGTATYFNKAVCDICHQAYGALLTDSTPPTGEITIGTNKFNQFLNTITFGLFFNESQTVEITAEDDSYTHAGYTQDDAVTVAYYLHTGDHALTLDELEDVTFTPYSETFSISPDQSYVVYAKFTDHAGNVTYVNSNGIVLDATAPAIIGVTDGIYYTTQSAAVADANLKTVTVNSEADDESVTLTGNVDQTYTIVAADQAGNTTTVTVIMKPISSLAQPVENLTTENVTSSNQPTLEAVKDSVADVDISHATDAEKAALDQITQQCDTLLDKVDQVAQDMNGVTDAVNALDPDTITSADKDTVEQLQSQLENLVTSGNLTEEEKGKLQETEEILTAVQDQLAQSQEAATTENLEKVEGITPDVVTLEDKDDLTSAKEDLEHALENFGGNYTQEETDALKEKLNQINQALDRIEQVEAVQSAIAALPDSAEPDDMDLQKNIQAAKDLYDALTGHQKSLVSEGLKSKLERLQSDVLDYRIIQGNGSQWTRGTDDTIIMTANGPVEKFIGLQVDGKDVASQCYTVVSGSTIVTLKPQYLNTLSIGKHTLTVKYTDGQAQGMFEILEQTTSPETGDHSQVTLWVACLLAAAFGLAGIMGYTGKKKHIQ